MTRPIIPYMAPAPDFSPVFAFWTRQVQVAFEMNRAMVRMAMMPWQIPAMRAGTTVPVTEPATTVAEAAVAATDDMTPEAAPVVTGTAAPEAPADVPATISEAPEAEPAAMAAHGGRPAGLEAPRSGAPDALTALKGLGPKLEEALNAIGVYHFDQIAAWTDANVAWADENLGGVRGRASRDDWRAQAAAMARGDDGR